MSQLPEVNLDDANVPPPTLLEWKGSSFLPVNVDMDTVSISSDSDASVDIIPAPSRPKRKLGQTSTQHAPVPKTTKRSKAAAAPALPSINPGLTTVVSAPAPVNPNRMMTRNQALAQFSANYNAKMDPLAKTGANLGASKSNVPSSTSTTTPSIAIVGSSSVMSTGATSTTAPTTSTENPHATGNTICYIVTSGTSPGIYFKLADATRAVGHHGIIHVADDIFFANALLLENYRVQKVIHINSEDEGHVME